MSVDAGRDDRGTTVPLILGFFIIAFTVVAGAVAAGAAGAANLDRAATLGSERALQFADVQRVVDDYLARDPGRGAVQIRAALSADARTLQLTCTETVHIAFGAMFGKGHGIRHVVTSSARAPLS